MKEKSYQLKIPGTGYKPHILENPLDPKDKLFLCSCGGTKNDNGFCDGTHNDKSDQECGCKFCKTKEQRVHK